MEWKIERRLGLQRIGDADRIRSGVCMNLGMEGFL